MNLKVAKFCHRASSKNLFDILTFYCLINHFSVSNISRFICHQSTAHIFAPMAPYWQWFFKSTNFSPLSWHVTWIGFWQNLTENANPHHRTTANLSDIVWCVSGGVWSMSGGVRWCLMHVWWCLVVSMYIGWWYDLNWLMYMGRYPFQCM